MSKFIKFTNIIINSKLCIYSYPIFEFELFFRFSKQNGYRKVEYNLQYPQEVFWKQTWLIWLWFDMCDKKNQFFGAWNEKGVKDL